MKQKFLPVFSQKCHVNNVFYLFNKCTVHDWSYNLDEASYNPPKRSRFAFNQKGMKLPCTTMFQNTDSQEKLNFWANAALLFSSNEWYALNITLNMMPKGFQCYRWKVGHFDRHSRVVVT